MWRSTRARGRRGSEAVPSLPRVGNALPCWRRTPRRAGQAGRWRLPGCALVGARGAGHDQWGTGHRRSRRVRSQSIDALTLNAQASTAPGGSHLLQELRHRLLEQRLEAIAVDYLRRVCVLPVPVGGGGGLSLVGGAPPAPPPAPWAASPPGGGAGSQPLHVILVGAVDDKLDRLHSHLRRQRGRVGDGQAR